MNRAIVAAAIAAAVTAVAPCARADDSADRAFEPTVARLADANLEALDRGGVIVAAAIAPEVALGFGSRGDVSTGAAVIARLGKYASPTTIVFSEVDLGATLHHAAGPAGLASNSDLALTVGAIHYLAPSLWLRASTGWGVYVRDDELVGGMPVAREVLPGPFTAFGAGLELVRWRARSLSLELFASSLVHRHGLVTLSGVGLALTL